MRLRRPLLALPAALACIAGLLACGGAPKRGTDTSGPSPVSAAKRHSAARTASSPSRELGYLNDGDAERNHDRDGDDRTVDHEDHDSDSQEEFEEANGNGRYHDEDDAETLAWGTPGPPGDARAVAHVVERYYRAAAARDGRAACAVLVPSLARSVAETYGGGHGAAYLRAGKSCPAVLSLLFAHLRRQLATKVSVTGVRLSDGKALAFVGSTSMPASSLMLSQETGAWMVDALIAAALP